MDAIQQKSTIVFLFVSSLVKNILTQHGILLKHDMDLVLLPQSIQCILKETMLSCVVTP